MWLLPDVFVFDNVSRFGSCLPNSRKIRLLRRLPIAPYIIYLVIQEMSTASCSRLRRRNGKCILLTHWNTCNRYDQQSLRWWETSDLPSHLANSIRLFITHRAFLPLPLSKIPYFLGPFSKWWIGIHLLSPNSNATFSEIFSPTTSSERNDALLCPSFINSHLLRSITWYQN